MARPRGEGTVEQAGDDAASRPEGAAEASPRARVAGRRLTRTVALVGLMGAGKTAVGKRIAAAVGARFRDADDEIERAAGMTIPEIFERYGEDYFRDREKKVISRLLDDAPHLLATGGGAYMNADTRSLLRQRAYTLWLKADLETLALRCGRRSGRPLLQNDDPRKVLERLMADRYPVYAEADGVVESRNGPHEATVCAAIDTIIEAGVLVKPEAGR